MSLYSDLTEVLTPYANKINELNGSLDDLYDNIKSIKIVADSNLMEDRGVIYMYTGNESGFKKGALYYYDGSKWTEVIAKESPKLPILNLSGSFDGVTKENTVKMSYTYTDVNKGLELAGWCQIKVQGQTSASWDKHNWKITFYKDPYFKNKDKINFGFGKQSKYTLKSNYNDYSMARNVVSCEIWGDMVKTRKAYPKGLSDTPNHGAVDGFPCLLYLNNAFYGLYSWNVDKNWMTDVDETNPLHALISANGQAEASRFISRTGIDNWEAEIPDVMGADQLAALQNLIDFVSTSTDEEFIESLDTYIDVESVIDYILFTWVIGAVDSLGKNIYLITYDSVKWYMSAYDLDLTFGNAFGGYLTIPYDVPYPKDANAPHVQGRTYIITDNKLFLRVIELMPTKVAERYNYLRKTVLSLPHMLGKFHAFMSKIDEDSRTKDVKKWNTRAASPNGMLSEQFISDWITNRVEYINDIILSLDPEYVICTGITLDSQTLQFNDMTEQTITATLSPAGCDEEIIWSTSDDSVCGVDSNGIVSPTGGGTATITAKCGQYTATCQVTVSDLILIWSDDKGYKAYDDGTYIYDPSVSSNNKYMTIRDIDIELGKVYGVTGYGDAIVYDTKGNPMWAMTNIAKGVSSFEAIPTIKEYGKLTPAKLRLFCASQATGMVVKNNDTWSTYGYYFNGSAGAYVNRWRYGRMSTEEKAQFSTPSERVTLVPIEVEEGDTYRCTGASPRISFYNENMQFISSSKGSGGEHTAVVPDRAKYMMVGTQISSQYPTSDNTITKIN